MRCTALIVAFGAGAFITIASQRAQAAEYVLPTFASTLQPATQLDPAYAEPRRQPYGWRPWALRRWSEDSGRFAPRWPDWSRRPAWRYGWGHRAPFYRDRLYSRRQPWPSWRTWPYDGGYRGYATTPWRNW